MDTVKTPSVDNELMEVPKSALLASKYLSDFYFQIGKPDSPLTPTGQKVMAVIEAIWTELYPLDAKTWSNDMTEYKNAELSTRQQVAQNTGRSLASVPLPIYQMMTKVFKDYKLDSREDWMKFLKTFPQYRAANKL